MSGINHSLDNPFGRPTFESHQPSGRLPEEFYIPPEHIVTIPQNILARVAEKQKETKYMLVMDVALAELADEQVSEEDRERLTTVPYTLLASDKYLYISSSTVKDPEHPHANLQIFRLEYNPATGAVTKVIRDADLSIFKVAMADFPDHTLIRQIRNIIAITPPSDEDRKNYGKIAADSEKVKATRDELQKLSNPHFFSGTLVENERNISHILQVGQAEYAITSNGKAVWLATHGATDCFIVSIYDRRHKRGALTHIDALTNVDATIKSVTNELDATGKQEKGEPRYAVTLSGGSLGSVVDIVRVYDEIKEWGKRQETQPDISIGNLFTGYSESLALNLNTGDVSHFIPMPHQSEGNSSLEVLRMQARAFESSLSGKKPARRIG